MRYFYYKGMTNVRLERRGWKPDKIVEYNEGTDEFRLLLTRPRMRSEPEYGWMPCKPKDLEVFHSDSYNEVDEGQAFIWLV